MFIIRLLDRYKDIYKDRYDDKHRDDINDEFNELVELFKISGIIYDKELETFVYESDKYIYS